ncbi:MAG TPA: DUF6151 family protein [Steroidobacteraceae bacterium]|jgi:hypothetical protein
MQHPLQCRCGTIQGWVSDPASANRVVCYCSDCQAFARFLGQESETLDAQGGSDIVQTLPKNVSFTQGVDALACMRLSDKGMIRWYAGCCRTPIGNTLENTKISFIGLLHNCLETAGHAPHNSFGPVRAYVNPRGALGTPKPKTTGTGAIIWWFLKTILKARINGDYQRTPFFKDGKPIAPPRVISGAERASAMQPGTAA